MARGTQIWPTLCCCIWKNLLQLQRSPIPVGGVGALFMELFGVGLILEIWSVSVGGKELGSWVGQQGCRCFHVLWTQMISKLLSPGKASSRGPDQPSSSLTLPRNQLGRVWPTLVILGSQARLCWFRVLLGVWACSQGLLSSQTERLTEEMPWLSSSCLPAVTIGNVTSGRDPCSVHCSQLHAAPGLAYVFGGR